MWLISRKAVREFAARYPDAKDPLLAWCREVEHATWDTPVDVKAAHRNASFVANNRVVFNIGGNKYRLIALIHYRAKKVFVRFIGTHKQYDEIEAEEA